MPIENDIFTIEDQGWITSIRLPSEKPAATILLLHGWTGDERSMWIFSQKLSSYLIFAPRGPILAELGFGWAIQQKSVELTAFSDFYDVIDRLADWAIKFPLTYQTKPLPIYLIGFSQGAALALILSICYPERFSRIAVLSGYLPVGSQAQIKKNALSGSSFFFAHGKNDEIVPFNHGQDAAEAVRLAGAKVTFCESDVGHKLDVCCLKNLDSFITG